MVLRIRGPLADRFAAMLQTYCGFDLDRDANSNVTVNADGLINPFVSPTLQRLVGAMIASAVTITVTARGDVHGGLVDSFFAVNDARRVPARTVFVNDLVTVQRFDPHLCAAMIAHFLAEYSHAAEGGTPRQFADAHVAGLRAEADVIHDLTGRPVFQGATRPWARTTLLPSGRRRAERRYGPGNTYFILLGPGPVFPIVGVSRSAGQEP